MSSAPGDGAGDSGPRPAARGAGRRLPRWADLCVIPVVNVATAFLISGLVVLTVGENPLEAVKILVWGAFGFGEGVGFTLFYATNFILTGLAVSVAFHAGLFNIGGEGQAYIGGLGVGLAALSLDRFVPWWVTFPVALAASILFGAVWALIPAWLQARRGSHIVITTIMFNFIAASIMVWLLVDFLSPPGMLQPETRTFETGGTVPELGPLFALVGLDAGGAPVNITLFVALAAAALVYVLIWRTRLGYEIRALGHNPTAAAYAGISTTRITLVAMMISGGLAGLMALNPIMGEQHRLLVDFVGGAGFVGIAVALMGRAHPVGVILASLLFGMLYQGGAELAFEIPVISRDMIVVIQGLVILFAGALEHMYRPGITRAFAFLPAPQRRPVAARREAP